jgi:hypothetical protein
MIPNVRLTFAARVVSAARAIAFVVVGEETMTPDTFDPADTFDPDTFDPPDTFVWARLAPRLDPSTPAKRA